MIFFGGPAALGKALFNHIPAQDDFLLAQAEEIPLVQEGNHLLAHNTSMLGVKDRIFRRYTAHGGAQFTIERFGLIPNLGRKYSVDICSNHLFSDRLFEFPSRKKVL